LITRDFPLLEGGNTAVLLAGLGLDPDIEVTERIGGAAATLDAIVGARAHGRWSSRSTCRRRGPPPR